MYPLVEQMLVAQHRNDLELGILEQTFEHEAKCQSSHEDNSICSVRVVATKRVGCEHRDFLICASSYRWNMESQAGPNRVCASCEKDTAECWTIRPI